MRREHARHCHRRRLVHVQDVDGRSGGGAQAAGVRRSHLHDVGALRLEVQAGSIDRDLAGRSVDGEEGGAIGVGEGVGQRLRVGGADIHVVTEHSHTHGGARAGVLLHRPRERRHGRRLVDVEDLHHHRSAVGELVAAGGVSGVGHLHRQRVHGLRLEVDGRVAHRQRAVVVDGEHLVLVAGGDLVHHVALLWIRGHHGAHSLAQDLVLRQRHGRLHDRRALVHVQDVDGNGRGVLEVVVAGVHDFHHQRVLGRVLVVQLSLGNRDLPGRRVDGEPLRIVARQDLVRQELAAGQYFHVHGLQRKADGGGGGDVLTDGQRRIVQHGRLVDVVDVDGDGATVEQVALTVISHSHQQVVCTAEGVTM